MVPLNFCNFWFFFSFKRLSYDSLNWGKHIFSKAGRKRFCFCWFHQKAQTFFWVMRINEREKLRDKHLVKPKDGWSLIGIWIKIQKLNAVSLKLLPISVEQLFYYSFGIFESYRLLIPFNKRAKNPQLMKIIP